MVNRRFARSLRRVTELGALWASEGTISGSQLCWVCAVSGTELESPAPLDWRNALKMPLIAWQRELKRIKDVYKDMLVATAVVNIHVSKVTAARPHSSLKCSAPLREIM